MNESLKPDRSAIQAELGEIWRLSRALVDVAADQSRPTRECWRAYEALKQVSETLANEVRS